MTSVSWTPELAVQWQHFYNNAPRISLYGRSVYFNYTILPKIPDYVDLNQTNCTMQSQSNTTNNLPQCGLAICQKMSIFMLFIPFLMKIIIEI